MCGYSGVECIHPFQPLGGQREVGAYVAFETREEEGSANVREESDGCLGHGEDGAFGGYADGSVHGKSHAAAHGYAVHVRYVGVWICCYDVVELIFQSKVGLRCGSAFRAGGVLLRERGHVAARAERFVACAADDND